MRTYVTAMLAVLASLTFSPVHAETGMELSFQSIYAPAQTQNIKILMPWAESFAHKSGGSLTVHFFPLSAVVEVTEVGHAIKSGMLDMGVWWPTGYSKENPYLFMMNMPFLSKSSRHGTALGYAMYETVPEFRKEMDDEGVLLSMWLSASFGIASVKEPIASPADLKGKRVLVTNGADAMTIEAWGGIPVLVVASDVYVGLQRGMGEALFTAIPYQKGLRIMEVAKYVTPLSSTANLMAIVVNRDVYEELSDAQKKLLHAETGRALSERIAASLDADVADVLKLYEESGAKVVNLTDDQVKVFHQALHKTIDTYWVPTLKDSGVKGDISATVQKFYDLADTVPNPGA